MWVSFDMSSLPGNLVESRGLRRDSTFILEAEPGKDASPVHLFSLSVHYSD